MKEASQKIQWLSHSNTGTSSMTMLACSLGEKYKQHGEYQQARTHSNPSDFNRCLELLKFCPFVRDGFEEISKLSPKWKAIIDNWEQLETCFIEEVGSNWEQSHKKTTKTYELMKQILGE